MKNRPPVWREALLMGFACGALFAVTLPFSLLVGWIVPCFWFGSAILIATRDARYPLLAAAVPNLTAHATVVIGLWCFTDFFQGSDSAVISPISLFGYLSIAGLLASTSVVTLGSLGIRRRLTP